jgi:dolichol-phosphate mannosyltransferase
MRVSIVLPTYNEKGNIAALVKEIQDVLDVGNIEHEIVVVDDNSPDGTADEIKDKFSDNSRVKLFVREKERGLATAIRYGIERSTGEFVMVMDTDFNHDPRLLPQFIAFLKYYDMIIGSRFIFGGGMRDRFRYYCSMIFTIWLRFFLGIRINDKLSGYFSMRKEKLRELDMDSIFFGYGDYFMRLLLKAQNAGYAMLEIPSFYQLRRSGDSKTNFIKIFAKYSREAIIMFFSKDRWKKPYRKKGS